MSNIDAEDIAKRLDYGSQIKELLEKWETLINKVSMMELGLYKLKDEIFNEEQKIISETDFKGIYGKNNADVRKQHLQSVMKSRYDYKKSVEIKLDENKRRIVFYGEKVRCLREFMKNGS